MGGPCPSAKAFHLVPGAPDGAVASTRGACFVGRHPNLAYLLLNVFQVVVNASTSLSSGDGARLVEKKEDLAPAIRLNSSDFNLGRLLGPALAGLVLAPSAPAIAFSSMASVT